MNMSSEFFFYLRRNKKKKKKKKYNIYKRSEILHIGNTHEMKTMSNVDLTLSSTGFARLLFHGGGLKVPAAW